MSTKSNFMQHPMNAAMLDPNMPVFDPGVYCFPYIGLAQKGDMPTEEQVEGVKNGVLQYSEHVGTKKQYHEDGAGIEATWPKMEKRLAGSPGLTQLMLDHGCNSRYFYTYLCYTGMGAYALALEMKDGYGMPVSLKGFEKIPKDDWAYIVAVEEPSHVARRFTDGIVQELLRGAGSIFEVGGALLPAYRHYGYPLGKIGQKIVTCDLESSMQVQLRKILDGPLGSYGIESITGDALLEMTNPKHFKAYDIVRMTGVLSYYPKTEEKKQFVEVAQRLLKNDNGVIVCDLQTMGPSLVRSALINLWPMDPRDPHKLTPSENVDTAIKEMSEIAKATNLDMVYKVDSCNGNPLCLTQVKALPKCVVFLLGKNVSEDMFDKVPELGI